MLGGETSSSTGRHDPRGGSGNMGDSSSAGGWDGASASRLAGDGGGTRLLGASSRCDQRAARAKGAVSKARSILSSASSHVGTGLATASVVSIGALLGAVSSGLRRGGMRLGNGARAVGDGQSGRLSDGVRLVVEREGGRSGAVGSVGGDDLGGVGWGLGGRLGRVSLGRASGRGDQRAIRTKGAVSETRSILGSTGGLVGVKLATAGVVGVVALGSTLVLGRGGSVGGLDGLADGARAVGNSQGSLLGDGVGLVVVSESGGTGTVGSQGSDNLGRVVNARSNSGVASDGRGMDQLGAKEGAGKGKTSSHFDVVGRKSE